jgi:hypothetical protein
VHQGRTHEEVRFHLEKPANEGASHFVPVGNFFNLLPAESREQDLDPASLPVKRLPARRMLREENNEMLSHLRTALLPADGTTN